MATPSLPPEAPSPLADRIAWLRANPPPPDPVHAWMAAHRDELAPHAGQLAAIDPEQGLLATGADYDAVFAALDARGIASDADAVAIVTVPR